MKRHFLDRALKLRHSTAYRVLQFVPTPARPYLWVIDALAGLRESRLEHRYERREESLLRALASVKSRKKRGGLGRMLLLGGAAWAVSRLRAKKPEKGGSGLRTTGFAESSNEALRR